MAKKGAKATSRKVEVSSGPVPIKKVPSLRGKNSVGLYAAGAFTTTAPSPGKLPVPPMRWRSPPTETATAPALPPPAAGPTTSVAQVVHPNEARLSILGNLLFLTLKPQLADLTGKVVGMLLELGGDEVGEILSSVELREEAVREALKVLRDDGDERAVRALNAPSAPQQQPTFPPGLGLGPGRLTVDVDAAHEAQAAAEGSTASTGLTPALQGSMLMRMSPRVSSNPFMTRNILAAGKQ